MSGYIYFRHIERAGVKFGKGFQTKRYSSYIKQLIREG